MTTPASNLDTVESISFTTETYVSWVGWTTGSDSMNIGGQRYERPVSVSNPVRPDGTRAPSGFDIKWFRGSAPRGRVEYRQQVGSDYLIRRSAGAAAFAAHPDYWLALCGAGWSRSTPSVFPLNVENMARTRFLTELSDGRAQLGATLGEMKQTVDLVSDLANDILKTLVATSRAAKRPVTDLVDLLTRGSLRPRRKVSRKEWPDADIIDRWLQYQFGVRPLFSDIEDLGQALSYTLVEDRQDVTAVIRKGYTDREFRTAVAGFHRTPSYEFHQPVLLETSAHISARYKIPVTADRTLNQLGLGNPASVAWELLQFSWMCDYVLGVGDWLGSLTASTGTQFIEGSISRKQEVTCVARGQVHPDPGVTVLSVPREVPSLVGGRFQREVLDTAVFPAVLPPLRNRLGLNQLANSLAALAQGRKLR